MITEDSIARYTGEVCDELVGPALVAIYDDREGKAEPFQSGTGFLLRRAGQTFLVTAHHCLFGSDPRRPQNPGNKCLFTGRGLRRLADVALSECAHSREHDVAVMCVEPFQEALPESALLNSDEDTPVIAVHGFLSRDFKRTRSGGGILKPQPLIVQQPTISVGEGFLLFSFARKGVVSGPNNRAILPLPKGLSGSPIVDALALAQRRVSIVGVFIEWENGVGTGATAQVIQTALDQLDTHGKHLEADDLSGRD